MSGTAIQGTGALSITSTTSPLTLNTATISTTGAITGGTYNGNTLNSTALTFSGASAVISGNGTTGGLSLQGGSGAGSLNLNTANTGNTAIGNSTGTFALTSNGGLNVTTAGAITGVSNLKIGSIGTSTSQLYVGGQIPSSAIGTVTTGTNPYSVAVSGRYAYIVNYGSASMQVIDVSNPASPTVVGTVTTGTNPKSVAVSGRYAYVANYGSASMQVIDVSNPASPTVVGTVTTGTNPKSVAVSGRYAYVANYGSASMQVIDVSNPASPTVVGTVTTGTNPISIAVSGRYAYIAHYSTTGLQVIDISNPVSPIVVGAVAGNFLGSVSVSGRYAYVASWGGNIMQVIDVSNPASPTVVGTVTTGTTPYSLTVSGRYAYVANTGSASLTTIDISNPASPTVVGTVTTGVSPISIAVSGRYAYVANYSVVNMQIFDLGGEYASSLEAGTAQIGNLGVDNNLTIQGSESIASGLNVGGSVGIAGNLSSAGTIQGGTLNAISALQLNGTNINTSGTLSNVAYLGQSNTFTGTTNTFSANSSNALTIQNTSNVNSLNVNTSLNSVGMNGQLSVPTGVTAGNPTSGGSLAASTTYTIEVTALDGAGNQTTPSASTTKATTATNKVIPVSWSAVTNAISYNVFYSANGGTTWAYYNVSGTSYSLAAASGTTATPPTFNSAFVNDFTSTTNSLTATNINGNTNITGATSITSTSASALLVQANAGISVLAVSNSTTASNSASNTTGQVFIGVQPTATTGIFTGQRLYADSAQITGSTVIGSYTGVAGACSNTTPDNASGNYVYFNPTSTNNNGFITTNFEPILCGTARHTQRISYSPEFTDSTLTPSTSNTAGGSITTGYDSANDHTYYQWTTTSSTAQTFDIYVHVHIPSSFSAFSSSTQNQNGQVCYQMYASSNTDANSSLTVRDVSSGGTVGTSSMPSTTNSWFTTTQFPQSSSIPTAGYNCQSVIPSSTTADSYVTLDFRMTTDNNNTLRLGEFFIPYASKY